jgi:hypothetical protein
LHANTFNISWLDYSGVLKSTLKINKPPRANALYKALVQIYITDPRASIIQNPL